MNFLRKIKSWVSKDNNQAVILHLYYIDLWPEFERYLGTLKDFDLYLSLSFTPPESFLQMVRIVFPKTKIFVWSNRGRDILPFLKIFKLIEPLNYRYICKIHSKKSLGRLDYDGACWRRDLLSSLLGSRAQVKKIKKIFSLDAKVGLIVPRDYYWNYQN
jgi:lipopolysaccharide biosynthesis protein